MNKISKVLPIDANEDGAFYLQQFKVRVTLSAASSPRVLIEKRDVYKRDEWDRIAMSSFFFLRFLPVFVFEFYFFILRLRMLINIFYPLQNVKE